jgi:hypothetical protein
VYSSSDNGTWKLRKGFFFIDTSRHDHMAGIMPL